MCERKKLSCCVSYRGHINFTAEFTMSISNSGVRRLQSHSRIISIAKNVHYVTDNITTQIYDASTIAELNQSNGRDSVLFINFFFNTFNYEMHTAKWERCIIVILCHWKWHTCNRVEWRIIRSIYLASPRISSYCYGYQDFQAEWVVKKEREHTF